MTSATARRRHSNALPPVDLDEATAARRDLLAYLRERDTKIAAMTPLERTIYWVKSFIHRFWNSN